jgi:hypothetical protein
MAAMANARATSKPGMRLSSITASFPFCYRYRSTSGMHHRRYDFAGHFTQIISAKSLPIYNYLIFQYNLFFMVANRKNEFRFSCRIGSTLREDLPLMGSKRGCRYDWGG